MRHKIIREYYKNIFFTTITIIFLWLLLSFLFLFNNKGVDIYLPQYLILSFGQYINITDKKVGVDEEGILALAKHDLWLQILNQDGVAVYGYNVPDIAKTRYTHSELVNYALESDRMYGYTLYVVPKDDYTVVMAGSNDLVQKISYNFIGNGADAAFQSFIILLAVMMIVMIVVGFLYGKKISVPISEILHGIEIISAGKEMESLIRKKTIFSDVFVQIQRLQEKLKENQSMRNQWISNISHDIKTPLSSIRGYAELLADYNLEKDEIRLYSKEIIDSEQVIESLLEELTLNQKLSEGKVVLKLAKTDTIFILRECILELEKKLAPNNTIKFIAPDYLELFVDKVLIKRCFQNILWNAFIHNDEFVLIEVRVVERDRGTEIIIKDNGKGMSGEDGLHIFERYYRGTASQTTMGTGLGLAIAKEIILAHGGEVISQSKQGGGVIFNIKL